MQIAQRKAREDAGERDGWDLGDYKWRQRDHLREARRGAAPTLEAEGRAEVADLYA